MADDTVSPGTSVPEWPAFGGVRPILASRAERRAKALLHAARTRRQPAGQEKMTDLDLVYQEVASPHPRVKPPALDRAFRRAAEPSAAIEASFATLALMIAARHRPRVEGLIAFIDLCYPPSERDAAAAALGARMRREGALPPGSPLARFDYGGGWATLAADVRDLAAAMERHTPRAGPTRFIGAELGPRRVVLRLSGGLGNQLFQYAAALGYARRTGAPLRLDLSNYDHPTAHREFLLGRLRIPVHRANSVEVVWTRRRPHFETRGTFDDFLFEEHGSAWLCGSWEDEAYFAGIVPTLKRRFVPRDAAIAAAAKALVEQARTGGEPVVGVHLRRGDRGPGGVAYAPFSTLPASYYRQAAARFPPDTNFLVFSDTPEDIAWCRENLGIADGSDVSFSDGHDPILDLFALAECDGVILSSGTFSWWAAYLGERRGRRVIAPHPLQGLSAERVMVPPPMPLRPGWECVTLASE